MNEKPDCRVHPNMIDVIGIGVMIFVYWVWRLFKRFWCFVLLLLVLIFSSCIEPKPASHIVSEEGVNCVVYKMDITCNWDEYNMRTAYGCSAELAVDEIPEFFIKDTSPD